LYVNIYNIASYKEVLHCNENMVYLEEEYVEECKTTLKNRPQIDILNGGCMRFEVKHHTLIHYH